MKKLILLIFLFTSNYIFGQAIEETITKIYYSNSDTITYKYSRYPDVFKLDLSINDTISPGTDVSKGIVMYSLIGKDTLTIKGDNFPFSRRSYVTIQTPKRKTVVIFRYNSVNNNFSQDYMENNEGNISFEIPEIYELANVIWLLSPSGRRAYDLQTNTAYSKEVEEYFKPFLNHPIFKKLDFPEKDYFEQYYSFRENSFIYEFENNKIKRGDNYYYVFGKDWDNFSNLFTELLPLVEDFALKSNFKKFYKQNLRFFDQDIERVKQLLPIKNMWNWLEKELPMRKYNSYKIVFSPLIGGSHSTQNYSAKNMKTNTWFSETVMFICDANRYDSTKDLTEKQKEGLMSGIVFTEIDHNYVNPTTSNYKKEISEIFNSKIWSDEKTGMYNNAVSVFNEYMTHAVYCLWVNENYDEETANFVIKKREELNVDKRNFCMFRDFNQELLKLRKENPNLTVENLYPKIIEWSKKQ